ncbi:hypothetical protein [Billgrantia tianxiuensis]|uniref:hypothetical protein n=1 Tax=Halomonadaceae TaxID=28256 RepID=UPI001F479009|nr:hypothetical protein [Halomonas tianxiuensis]
MGRYRLEGQAVQGYASHHPGLAETTKIIAGTRTIDLPPRALEALKAQKPISFLHPSGRGFINPRTGEPWTGDQAIRKTMWTYALKRAGVGTAAPTRRAPPTPR